MAIIACLSELVDGLYFFRFFSDLFFSEIFFSGLSINFKASEVVNFFGDFFINFHIVVPDLGDHFGYNRLSF